MTTREALHQLVDQLPDDQMELARVWLADLRDATDEDGSPLDESDLAALEQGMADIAGGRCQTLEEYERERGLWT